MDGAAAAPTVAMWRALAEGGVDDGCPRLGYPPHATLGQTDAFGRAMEVLAPLWRRPFSGRLDRLELVCSPPLG
ncbi:MAG: hypothetical protein ICV73_22775 [Acetobacteraceae bacterium]|nr:hypothetical protein [Acetobacteraceae bacterium]